MDIITKIPTFSQLHIHSMEMEKDGAIFTQQRETQKPKVLLIMLIEMFTPMEENLELNLHIVMLILILMRLQAEDTLTITDF